MQLYNLTPESNYGFRKCCEAVQGAVPIEEIARRYTELKPLGGRAWFTGCCPLPDHDDQEPSFYIYPPGRWWCYGCNRGGDVIDLEFLCNTYGELWEAMISLAMEYSVELPGRPQRWHDKEKRHADWREVADRVRAEVVRRRVFRLLVLPTINQIEHEAERRAELERAWEDFCQLNWRMFIYWQDGGAW